MGIYIPHASPPKDCYTCEYEAFTDCPCAVVSASDYKGRRHPDCPIIEVNDEEDS